MKGEHVRRNDEAIPCYTTATDLKFEIASLTLAMTSTL
jgi:hypothetical protein